MLETDACVAGEQTKLVFVFTPLEPASSSADTLWEPAPSRRNVNQTQPICTLLIWNERESLIGILIMPTENFWFNSSPLKNDGWISGWKSLKWLENRLLIGKKAPLRLHKKACIVQEAIE